MEGDFDAKIIDVFNTMKPELSTEIGLQLILEKLENAGIFDQRDPRLENLRCVMKEIGGKAKCFYDIQANQGGFTRIVNVNRDLLLPALLDDLVVPKFLDFVCGLQKLYENEVYNCQGEVTKRKAVLNNNSPDAWGVAVTTVDGQRCFIGDSEASFLLHSLSKPLVYGMALDRLGVSEVEELVGHESVHTQSDILTLDSQGRPRSAMLDSGFMMLCLMLFGNKDHAKVAEEHKNGLQFFNDLAGNEYVQHRTQVFMEAKQHAFHPVAIANLLISMGKIPVDTNISEACDFYYEAFSMEANCESLSLIAATLANGGLNPLTLKQVLTPKAVKYVLSSMYTSGLYKFSGQSAFLMGNPGKSSSSGAMMFVIPGVLGIALYSPRLNSDGNSVRGLCFMKEFIDTNKFHLYDNLTSRVKKRFPARKNVVDQCNTYCEIFTAVVNNDLQKIIKLSTSDMIHAKDHDQRTILHVAAALGFAEIVKYVVSKHSYLINEKDRWGRTPMDYGKRSGSQAVVDMLQDWEKIMSPTKQSLAYSYVQ